MFNSSLIKVIVIGLIISVFHANSACAGGRDYTAAEQAEASQRREVLNWQRWSKPRIEGETICRDRDGNTVCLSKTSSRKVNWTRR